MDVPTHCRRGSVFYDRPIAPDDSVEVSTPADWLTAANDDWVGAWPMHAPQRTHGWKIHLSFRTESFAESVRAAASVCFRTETPFKYVPSATALTARNAKNADRTASGKAMTIYPASDESLESLVPALETVLRSERGPYVLSDVRHLGAPIYFRYGAFLPFVMTRSGDEIPSVPDAGGVLGPDRREPVFVEPRGVPVPAIVRRAIDEYRRVPAENPLDRYRSITPMHFSNAGGVYSAVDPGGALRVIKEARSGAGLDGNGDDAVRRLSIEWANLVALDGTGTAPAPIERFSVLEHEFMVVEFIEGETLADRTARSCPALRPESGRREDAEYGAATTSLLRSLATAIERLHEQGIVVGDLHPGNVMVQYEDVIRLVDLEDGRHPDDAGIAPFNGLGYGSPEGSSARESDWYAFARTAMSAFEPGFARELLAPDWWRRLLDRVRRRYGSEVADLIDAADRRTNRGGRRRRFGADRVGLRPVRAGNARSQLLDGLATARRDDPLLRYPSDPRGIDGIGRFSCAHGLAGVLLALRRAGETTSQSDLDVLLGTMSSVSAVGLFDGLSGVATVFEESGRPEDAAALRSRVRSEAMALDEAGLERGLIGIALAHTRSDPDFALDVARLVARRLGDARGRTREALRRTPGLFRGLSGVAFGLARLARLDPTGEVGGAALDALDDELGLVHTSSAGTVGLVEPDGTRVFPYLANGSAGLLVAFAEVRAAGLIDEQDPRWTRDVPSLVTSCSGSGYVFDGLFHGFAGVLVGLRAVAPYVADAAEALARGEESLLDRALVWRGSTQFAGDGLLRLSCDLATGSAGILASPPATSRAFDWLPVPQVPAGPTDERG